MSQLTADSAGSSGVPMPSTVGTPPTLVEVCTDDFAFTVAVCTAEAPVSSAYFLADVDAEVLDGSSIFRIVKLNNQPQTHPAKIEVIQMGLRETDPTIAPTIQHESTRTTGLQHRRGTVSLARFSPGAVYHSIFICMRDEPSLDEGGTRHSDGLGFAAFGLVVEGFEHLQRIFEEHACSAEFLAAPIGLRKVRKV